VYDINVGADHHPHRFGGYATERLFAEQLLKSPFITQASGFLFQPLVANCSQYCQENLFGKLNLAFRLNFSLI